MEKKFNFIVTCYDETKSLKRKGFGFYSLEDAIRFSREFLGEKDPQMNLPCKFQTNEKYMVDMFCYEYNKKTAIIETIERHTAFQFESVLFEGNEAIQIEAIPELG